MEEAAGAELTAAQRARAERQRARAKALREARLIERPHPSQVKDAKVVRVGAARELDSGGGFLLPEEPPAPPRRASPPPAPPLARHERPRCDDCGTAFDRSYLLDTFDHPVCDDCRDDEEAHALVTRTEAKSQFLLQDCDLDARGGPLRCVRRRNPHRAASAPMRLYLRAQVLQRAHEAWGGADGLAAERARRDERREKTRADKYTRELRALRMTVRSSLYARTGAAAHEHCWGPETHDAASDEYSHVCLDCGLAENYEKM